MPRILLSLCVLVVGFSAQALAATVYGVNTANQLIRFNTQTPGTLDLQLAITGLQPGENVLGIDFRPANRQLYALGSSGSLYTLNLTTAAATLVATLSADPTDATSPFAGLSGTEFGFDFNPVVDRIRIVSDADQNLRVNPDTGAVITDGLLAFAVGDTNVGDNPAVTASAYTNNFPGATTTTLFGIDTFNDTQVTQNPPNDGTLVTSASLFLGDIEQISGFEIQPGVSQGLLAYTNASNPSASLLVSIFPGSCCPFPIATPNIIGGGSRVRAISVAATSFFRLSADNYVVDESAGSITIPIFRFGDTSTSASVSLVTSDGTAIAPFDYNQSNNSVFFNAGDTVRTIQVSIVNNAIPEGTETFSVALSSPSSSEPITLDVPRVATVTITEGGAPPPPSQPLPVTVFGVSLNNRLFSFRSTNPFTIDYSVAITGLQPSEGILNIDIRPANGLIYALGSSARLYTLNPITGAATLVSPLTADPSDATDPFASLSGGEFGFDFDPVMDRIRINSDADQNLRVNPDNGTVITGSPLAYPLSDPNGGRNPSVTGAAHSNPDNDPGTGTTLYSIDVASDMFTTQNPPDDGTLNTIGPLNTDLTPRVGFDIAPDNTGYVLHTPPGGTNNFLRVNLDSGSIQFSGGSINFPDVVRDIAVALGDAGVLQFSASTYTVDENAGTVTVIVNRTGGSNGTVTVNYSTAPGSATAGDDFVTSSGVLIFGAGQTSAMFTVPINDDAISEFSEQFSVMLSAPAGGAALGNTTFASVSIMDNETLPSGGTLSINDVSVAEGDTGALAVFTVTLSSARTQTVSVQYISSNGTASAGADYDAVSGTLTFTPGLTSRTITVPIIGDSLPEGSETFFVNLSNPTNAPLTDSQGQGTITDDEAPAAVFAFSAASFADLEDCATILVTVNRTGTVSGAMTVDYSTSNGTASDRSDYTLSLGTLAFAAGETSRTIPILISEDSFVEGTETLTITLSNPTGGGGLSGPTSATVVIIDDAPETTTNPIDDPETFVCQHYHDFLNREPDPAGLAFWTGEITGCGTDQACINLKRQNVSAAFFLSIEFQQTGFLVQRTFQGALNRFPRYLEFIPDTQRISRNVVIGMPNADAQLEANKQEFFAEFVTRSEFTSIYSGLTNEQYVDALNANTGGSLSTAERNALVAGLNGSTETRATVLRAVAEDADFSQREFNRAFVLMQYFGYMRRSPNDPPDSDFSGFNFWLDKLNQFNGDFVGAQMVLAFIESIEYRQRFGQ
jgi:hypothetical protein